MDTGRILKEAGLRPRKGLGQNFLVDPTVPPKIVNAAELAPDDTVIEVGPGIGVLTEELARRLDPVSGHLIAVELDESLLPVLQQRMAPYPQFRLVQGDVLQLQPADLLAESSSPSPQRGEGWGEGRNSTVPEGSDAEDNISPHSNPLPAGARGEYDSPRQGYKLVANLPYYITSAVLRHFLSSGQPPDALVVMVQREVAERIVAGPPDMSLLAVSVQFYGAPKIMFRVPPGAFMPPPKVNSAVLRVLVYPPAQRPVQVSDEEWFFTVLRAGFGQKRKQLANSLSVGLDRPKSDVGVALARAGVAGTRRAETLALPEWATLAEELRR